LLGVPYHREWGRGHSSGSSSQGEAEEEPSEELSEEALSSASEAGRRNLMEVFMPPWDCVARRLAVVYLDPPNGFLSSHASITAALFDNLHHLQFECVPSGQGAC
jgi:hypothetical protein